MRGIKPRAMNHLRLASARSSFLRFILSLSPSASRRAAVMRACICSPLVSFDILKACLLWCFVAQGYRSSVVRQSCALCMQSNGRDRRMAPPRRFSLWLFAWSFGAAKFRDELDAAKRQLARAPPCQRKRCSTRMMVRKDRVRWDG